MSAVTDIVRKISVGMLLLFAGTVLGQSVSVTRVGSASVQCLAPDGSLVSRHTNLENAQESCTNEALKHPGTYLLRTSDVSVIGTADVSAPLVFALTFNPTCSAIVPLDVKIGVPFLSPPLASCYGGDESTSAVFSLSGGPSGLAIDAVTGALSHSGSGPASNGSVIVRRKSASGVTIEFARNWRVAP